MLIQTERGLIRIGGPVTHPAVPQKVLQNEREWVLQWNASAKASNELREATNHLRPTFASFNCEPPHREPQKFLPWPEADGTYTPINS